MPNQRMIQLLAANCQFELAAEQLSISQVDLVSELYAVREDDGVVDVLKYMMMLRTYDLLMQVRLALTASLDDFSPTELAKLYKDLMSGFNTMLAPDQQVATDDVDDSTAPDDVKAKLIYKLDDLAKRRPQMIAGSNGHSNGNGTNGHA